MPVGPHTQMPGYGSGGDDYWDRNWDNGGSEQYDAYMNSLIDSQQYWDEDAEEELIEEEEEYYDGEEEIIQPDRSPEVYVPDTAGTGTNLGTVVLPKPERQTVPQSPPVNVRPPEEQAPPEQPPPVHVNEPEEQAVPVTGSEPLPGADPETGLTKQQTRELKTIKEEIIRRQGDDPPGQELIPVLPTGPDPTWQIGDPVRGPDPGGQPSGTQEPPKPPPVVDPPAGSPLWKKPPWSGKIWKDNHPVRVKQKERDAKTKAAQDRDRKKREAKSKKFQEKMDRERKNGPSTGTKIKDWLLGPPGGGDNNSEVPHNRPTHQRNMSIDEIKEDNRRHRARGPQKPHEWKFNFEAGRGWAGFSLGWGPGGETGFSMDPNAGDPTGGSGGNPFTKDKLLHFAGTLGGSQGLQAMGVSQKKANAFMLALGAGKEFKDEATYGGFSGGDLIADIMGVAASNKINEIRKAETPGDALKKSHSVIQTLWNLINKSGGDTTPGRGSGGGNGGGNGGGDGGRGAPGKGGGDRGKPGGVPGRASNIQTDPRYREYNV